MVCTHATPLNNWELNAVKLECSPPPNKKRRNNTLVRRTQFDSIDCSVSFLHVLGLVKLVTSYCPSMSQAITHMYVQWHYCTMYVKYGILYVCTYTVVGTKEKKFCEKLSLYRSRHSWKPYHNISLGTLYYCMRFPCFLIKTCFSFFFSTLFSRNASSKLPFKRLWRGKNKEREKKERIFGKQRRRR